MRPPALRRRGRRLAAVLAVGTAAMGGCSESAATKLSPIDGAGAPDAVAVRATGNELLWIERTKGTLMHRDERTGRITPFGAVPASTDGEQRGLLGFAAAGTPSTLFAAWTRADHRLVVTELPLQGGEPRVVWNGTTTETKAIGGHLETRDGRLVLGLGELTGWAKAHGSGAIVTLDPDGPPDQEPTVLTDGWHNPFAFTIADDGSIWVADNAPDGGPERIGRGDVPGLVAELGGPQRAPSSIAILRDGRLAVCGFLDGEVRAYRAPGLGEEGDTDDGGEGFAIERAGTVAKGCTTGLAVDPSGVIVVATEDGLARVVGDG